MFPAAFRHLSGFARNRPLLVIRRLVAILLSGLLAAPADAVNRPGVVYPHGDHRLSTALVTDAAGNAMQAARFAPFGNPNAADPDHRFTGQRQDAGSGLHYFHARHYDAALGRFLSPDPRRQFRSPYGLAAADPMRFVDPDGRAAGSVQALRLFLSRTFVRGVQRARPTVTMRALWLLDKSNRPILRISYRNQSNQRAVGLDPAAIATAVNDSTVDPAPGLMIGEVNDHPGSPTGYRVPYASPLNSEKGGQYLSENLSKLERVVADAGSGTARCSVFDVPPTFTERSAMPQPIADIDSNFRWTVADSLSAMVIVNGNLGPVRRSRMAVASRGAVAPYQPRQGSGALRELSLTLADSATGRQSVHSRGSLVPSPPGFYNRTIRRWLLDPDRQKAPVVPPGTEELFEIIRRQDAPLLLPGIVNNAAPRD